MKSFTRLCVAAVICSLAIPAMAHINPELHNAAPPQGGAVSPRNDCAQATQQMEMAINNVRALLLNGGDVWWDLDDGRYIVPNVDPTSGIPAVSSLFAGAVWIGGYDDVGNLKLAAQTYRDAQHTDFWPGPLTSVGTTAQDTCKQWDRFFRVLGVNIRAHIRAYEASVASGIPMDCDAIPEDIRAWPGKGNPYFFEIYGWNLPFDAQGLGAFWDEDGDELYDPCQGDYPVIEVRGCLEEPNFPDEMIFWIYNDAGNIHTNSQGDPIRMEVQVQAFAYATNDEINDMTFQRYKLINRATSIIDSCFFAMWIDPDLGCYTDDYIGCDTSRSLMYVYNEDALDGTNGCDCDQSVPTYCDEVPVLGVDYFRGPRGPKAFIDTVALDWEETEDIIFISSDVVFQDSLRIVQGERRVELGMSSFTYYNNGSVGNPIPATTDPDAGAPLEFYRYISGSWKDGSPFCFGGSGYNVGPGCVPIKYAFPDPPNQTTGWSMATAGLPFGDRRTLQATGPLRLDPGEVNELIIGAVWIPDVDHPNPDVSRLFSADGIAQSLFDNCFVLPDGPDAPDLDMIELDRELIMILTNDINSSNNAYELYSEKGLEIPDGEEDSLYVFEGYKVYQLSGPDVVPAQKDDITKSRLIFQADIKNGVNSIYNWVSIPDPTPNATEPIWLPEIQVQGADNGIRHTFRVTEDQFASEDRRLINHKNYYFLAVAYGYNNFEFFNAQDVTGQRRPYLEGRNNVRTYKGIPRPIVYAELNSMYGQGPTVTRLSGVGAGNNFLDITDESREAICMGTNNCEVHYQAGEGPIQARIFNPLEATDGCFILEFEDADGNPAVLSPTAFWRLYSEDDPSNVLTSERSIQRPNEQIVADYGFSITVGQTDDVGDRADATNGVIGWEMEFKDPEAEQWLGWFPEGGGGFGGAAAAVFDFLKIDNPQQEDYLKDPTQAFYNIEGFYPFHLCDYRKAQPAENILGYMVTPTWLESGERTVRDRPGAELWNLNNVDIVLTNDKSKWSRCIVVETANSYFTDLGLTTAGGSRNMERRNVPSVTKEDSNGDGLPDADPNESRPGLGWFPGYAVDVESGTRLNIFFGENSIYNDALQMIPGFTDYPANGDDMMWNPSSQVFATSGGGFPPVSDFAMGGMHYVYVTQTPYDECESLVGDLAPNGSQFLKLRALPKITWAGMPIALEDEMLSYADGLIPNEVVMKIRVDNPYNVSTECTGEPLNPKYRICFDGVEPSPLETRAEYDAALDQVNVVPNPYYGYSAYETTTLSTTVKITNLPAQCNVTIFSVDGRFIRQYRRNEAGVVQVPGRTNPPIYETQVIPDIEWDLKNHAGIPIASGVYLIHVDSPQYGERVIKWFGVNRQFDPSGL